MDTDESLYHATPQTRGRIAHESVDSKTANTHKSDLKSLSVFSERYGLIGKIDVFKQQEKLLIERKYQLKQIYKGQIYQLWAQYLCLIEMGYGIDKLAFYEISTNKIHHINLPNEYEIEQFVAFLETFRNFDPISTPIEINLNKCRHCIYCNICDKTTVENVYQ